ncbi:3'-5' exonuclease [Arthrobacter sp. BHU FT2]|nr:3'-5' exonuclease [Arthrobacter sp. BHU FT2]
MEALVGLLFVVALFWWRIRKKKRQPQNSSASAEPKAATAEVPNKPLIYTQPRVERPVRSHGQPMRLAQPGRVGELFSYGGPSSGRGYSHDGPFAVIDVETTGFSPAKGDRVIELAIARVDKNGRIEDEYATLLNPEGRDTGAVFIHGISNDAVKNAPLFSDVLPEVLARLDGAVIVAHNAVFEEKFSLLNLPVPVSLHHRSLPFARYGWDSKPLILQTTSWVHSPSTPGYRS